MDDVNFEIERGVTMKKILSIVLSLVMVVGLGAFPAFAQGYQDGTYEGSGKGMGGDVPVTVTVKDGKIVDVKVGEHQETAGIGDMAIEKLPQGIVDKQSTEVDGVSGATLTSDAIKEAVKNALAGVSEEKEAFKLAIKPDVIVVGAGMAGLVASVRAAELGANVLTLEQHSRVGGSANTAGGSISGTGYKAQIAAGIEDSPEKFYEDFVSMGGGEQNMNTEIAMVHAQRSGEAIDWLTDYVGVEMSDQVDTGGYLTMNTDRVTYTAGGASSGGGLYFVDALMKKLQPFLDKGTAQLAVDTMVTDLILDENKDVLGVVAGGVEISAPSVIIATGGYGYSEKWLKEFNFTNITSNDPPTAIGSGYDFARAAGAAFDNMNYSSCYGGSVPVSGFQASLRASINYPGAVWVDQAGARMFSEPDATSMDKRTVWRTAKDNIVYILVAENMIKEDTPLFTGMMSNSTPFTTQEKLAELQDLGYAFKADSMDALAELLNMPELAKTMETYNNDVAAGKDSAFGRTKDLQAFEGTVYAIYTVPYLMMTAGGPRMNGDAALVREDGSVVKNVYIAGEIIGSANIAGHNTIGGIGHGLCATWGRIAAENAVKNAGK